MSEVCTHLDQVALRERPASVAEVAFILDGIRGATVRER
jgi:hypothetical protein